MSAQPFKVSLPDPKINKHLKQDPVIPGQEWCVLAFLSPEDLVAKRELFLLDNFLHEVSNEYIKATAQHMSRAINAQLKKQFDVQVERYRNSKNESHRLMAEEMDRIRREEIQIKEDDFATECLHQHYQSIDDLKAKFDDFKVRRRPQLDPQFNKQHQNRPSVRGVKFGGAFATRQEAEERAEYLTSLEGYVHRFVPTSFHWLEFDPDVNAVPEQRTGHSQLDELLKTRKDEQKRINKHFQEDTRDRITEGRRENEDRKAIQQKYTKTGSAQQPNQIQEIPVNQMPSQIETDGTSTNNSSVNNASGYQPIETQAPAGLTNMTAEQIIANARSQNADIQRRLKRSIKRITNKSTNKPII